MADKDKSKEEKKVKDKNFKKWNSNLKTPSLKDWLKTQKKIPIKK